MTRPVLYDFKDQMAKLNEWAHEVINELYYQFEGRGCGGLIYKGECYQLQTSRDNHKDTGYIAFHEGYIAWPLYLSVGHMDSYSRWPERVESAIANHLESLEVSAVETTCRHYEGEYQSFTTTHAKGILEDKQALAKKWEKHGTNLLHRWEPNYEGWQWMQTYFEKLSEIEMEDEELYQLKLNVFYQEFDEDDDWPEGTTARDYGDRLTARLSVNIDGPYYRERVAWLGENAQQEFDMWETSIEYTGVELTDALLTQWAAEIDQAMWSKEDVDDDDE